MRRLWRGGECYHGADANMAAGEGQSAVDRLVTEFATYSDFLDSQITPTDLYYLEVHKYSQYLVPVYTLAAVVPKPVYLST